MVKHVVKSGDKSASKSLSTFRGDKFYARCVFSDGIQKSNFKTNDVNRLIGISYAINPINKSVCIGWRYNPTNGKIDIYAIIGNNGKCDERYIISIHSHAVFEAMIEFKDGGVEFTIMTYGDRKMLFIPDFKRNFFSIGYILHLGLTGNDRADSPLSAHIETNPERMMLVKKKYSG